MRYAVEINCNGEKPAMDWIMIMCGMVEGKIFEAIFCLRGFMAMPFNGMLFMKPECGSHYVNMTWMLSTEYCKTSNKIKPVLMVSNARFRLGSRRRKI